LRDKKYINKIVEAAQAGDRSAFSRVIELHYDMIYRVAYKWCGHQEDAQDIAQDVCVKLARNINKFTFQSAFSSWLYRVTLNTLRDYKRKERDAQNIDDVQIVSAEAAHDEKAYQRQILDAVNDLPLKERTAILLTAAEGLTHKQVAEVLGTKESTVSWYIHEGRKKLKHLLEKKESNKTQLTKKGGQNHG
jgi:RNA polymerase sigma-70 factor (ECF subfamily)